MTLHQHYFTNLNSCYLIAEIGVNHNGDMELARKMIDAARQSGADAVKFQKRTIETVYSKDILDQKRESPWGKTQRDQKKALEFNLEQYEEINDYCKNLSIDWYASAWDLNSQFFLQKFNLKYNKIASAMIVYKDLLKLVASEKKHTFISTGMSTMDQIKDAIGIFNNASCSFELMHTVSTYPMKDEHANLRLIKTLRDNFNCNVGYSGHENGVAISIAAVSFGITSLERHITLDRAMYGSDQAASLEHVGLKQLVGGVRKVCLALGDGVKKIIPEEQEVSKKLRQHLYL